MSPAHPLDDDAPLRLPESWPLKRWAPIARDRIGEVGAVTRLQRSNARTFFAMTTVSVRQDGAWFDEFVNGAVGGLAGTPVHDSTGR